MKRLLFTIVILSCSFSLFGANQIEIGYKKSINIFTVLDHVALASKNPITGYREYFDKKKLNKADLNMLEEYQELVNKYRKSVPLKEDSLFFQADSLKDSPLLHAFYVSKDINSALTFLKKYIKMKELKFLEKFYNHFLPKMKELLAESELFRTTTKGLDKEFNKGKLKNVVRTAINFLNLKKIRGKLKVYYIWLPPGQLPYVRHAGYNVFLGFNPVFTANFGDYSYVLEAVIKALFAVMPKSDKQTFSKQFLSVCTPPRAVKVFQQFQMPLVLALGNMMYEEKIDKNKFTISKQWSLSPWESSYSKILFQLAKERIKKKETIGGGFIRMAAKECSSLERISTLGR